MGKFFIIFIFAISLFASSNKELQKVSLQLHWIYEYNFAGFIIAKEKGYYKDVGLDVEIREYKYGMDIEEEVLSHRATFGIYNSRLLLDYLNGKPIKLLASYFKRAALVIVAQPDIKTLNDLVGKKIMAATKKDFELNFRPYFDKYNIDINKVNLIPHTFKIDEFIDKKVDGMTAFMSNEVTKLKDKGIKFNIFDPSDENIFIMQMELFTSDEVVKRNKNMILKFLKATQKGWEYVFENRDEVVDLMYKKYNYGYSKKDIYQEAIAVEKLMLPYTYDIGSIDKSFLKKQAKIFKKDYNLKTQRTINDFIFQVEEEKTEFTFKELKYIKNNPTITICPHYNLFPIDGVDKEGKETAIMGDIFKIISKKTGLKFKVVKSNSYEDIVNHLIKKDCKILPIALKDSLEPFNLYATKPILKTYFTLVLTLDKPFVKDILALKGKTFLMKDTELSKYIKKLYPYINIKLIPDNKKMVDELLKGNAYSMITLDEQADYFIDEFGYGKLKLGGFLAKENPVIGVIAIQGDEEILASIIQKVVYSIPAKKIENIINRWRMTRYHKQIDYKALFEIALVAFIILLIMYYYQRKLKKFNQQLESKVYEKTKQLIDLNEKLEALVEEKVKEITQKDKMMTIQSKQAIMGEMITMIAHQWRQPLNTLTLQISNLQLRRMMGEKLDIEEYDKTLNEISKTITYLSETIDDFQTFFHTDRELNIIYINELVRKAVNFVLPRTKGKNIEIKIDIKDNFELKVYVNEMIQVLLNLLNNAIDALVECKKNKPKKIVINAFEKDKNIIISVKDTACGIDEKIIDRLFEPYFSTKGKNGTGLGLYMSQMIIQKQFNGDIKVKSSKEGSEFIIKIDKF